MERYYTPPIPNGWFQVAYGDELAPGTVLPLRYFGKDLVAFRTESGEVSVLDAFCPHLGAHLGHGGKVVGDKIVCPFHAWEFDASGSCVGVPYAKNQPKKASLRRWHVREVAGLVMVWHHAEGKPPEFELPEVPEYQSPDWTDYDRRRWTIRTRNQEMAENAVDSAHFHYVHGTKNIPRSEATVDGPVLRVYSDAGMETPRGKVDASIESISYGFGFALVRFRGIVETLIVESTTPIDADHVDVRFSFTVKKVGGADITRGVGKAFVAEVTRQLEEDIPIWENKIQHEHPLLCDGDGPIGVFRRWSRQFYCWPEEARAAE
ncbi:MAG: aromatic ring-hydroxylating dioxygenase subunit alpha [Myxococcales bacterium]|nr:aromatic ring-hydroxylating dioxygenase subunit alpha [Myxococcales bacterium]